MMYGWIDVLETLKRWTRWIFKWSVILLVIEWAIGLTPIGRDDSDSGSWGGGRSGMKVMTDALTGCQYLSVPGAGITPRLDGYWRHVGCRK
jgi:hypothetical protein